MARDPRPEASDSHEENPKADPYWEWAKEPEVREAVRPLTIADGFALGFGSSDATDTQPPERSQLARPRLRAFLARHWLQQLVGLAALAGSPPNSRCAS